MLDTCRVGGVSSVYPCLICVQNCIASYFGVLVHLRNLLEPILNLTLLNPNPYVFYIGFKSNLILSPYVRSKKEYNFIIIQKYLMLNLNLALLFEILEKCCQAEYNKKKKRKIVENSNLYSVLNLCTRLWENSKEKKNLLQRKCVIFLYFHKNLYIQ